MLIFKIHHFHIYGFVLVFFHPFRIYGKDFFLHIPGDRILIFLYDLRFEFTITIPANVYLHISIAGMHLHHFLSGNSA